MQENSTFEDPPHDIDLSKKHFDFLFTEKNKRYYNNTLAYKDFTYENHYVAEYYTSCDYIGEIVRVGLDFHPLA